MDGLLYTAHLDGAGGATFAGEELFSQLGDGLLWVHLDYKQPQSARLLHDLFELDETLVDALTAVETRPRCMKVGPDGFMGIFRAVNLNPGAEPDDMVSVRCFIRPGLIITLRHRRIMGLSDVRELLEAGQGPKNEGDFIKVLLSKVLTRLSDTMTDFVDQLDDLEELMQLRKFSEVADTLSDWRYSAIALRRYLMPQREVFQQLLALDLFWLTERVTASLREFYDRQIRLVEDLESARDRAMMVRDELESVKSEQMNRTMYVLSVITAMFLPLGLITGLLGINVGGMPGTDNPAAFWVVCVIMLIIAAFQWLIFARLRR